MKKLKLSYLTLIVIIGLFMTVSSCSNRETKDLDSKLSEIVSDDDQLVITGDISRLFDQLEITVTDGVPRLPGYLKDALNTFGSGTAGRIEKLFGDCDAVEFDNIVMTMKKDENTVDFVLVFGVRDINALVEKIKSADSDVESTKKNGYTVFHDAAFSLLLKDGTGYALFTTAENGGEPVEIIEAMRKAASENPLAQWKKEFLKKENVFNSLVNQKLLNRKSILASVSDYAGFSLNLAGPSLTLVSVYLDGNGNEVRNPYMGDFDTSLIDYAYPGDMVGLSLSMNSNGYNELSDGFSKFLTSLGMGGIGVYSEDGDEIEAYIEAFAEVLDEYVSDKGLFVAAGLDEDANLAVSDFASPSTYHFVVAADLKPEKSLEAYDSLLQLFRTMNAKVSMTATDGAKSSCVLAFEINNGYDGGTGRMSYVKIDINMVLDGDVLVLSNAPVRKDSKHGFDSDVFRNTSIAFQMVLNSDYPLIKEFNVKEGIDWTIRFGEIETGSTVTVTDTDKKFVPALVGIFTDFGK